MRAKKKKQRGWLSSAFMGSGFALAITMLLLGLQTYLTINERVGEDLEPIIISTLKIFGIMIGAELAKRVCGNNDVRICVTVAGLYFAVTAIGGLLVDGKFENVWYHLLVIIIGSIMSCALCILNTDRKGKRKKPIW